MPYEIGPGDPRLVKKQVVMLKRKYSELAGRLDRLHRQVKQRRHQRLFPCVAAPEPSESDRATLEKAHKGRMLDFMQRHCRRLLNTMMERPFGHVFNVPVDTDKYPNYLSVVDTPMDFGTIRRRIDTNSYTTLDAFVADVNLVLTNARKFNAPHSLVHHMADALQMEFNKGLLDTVVKAACMVELQAERELEAQKADMFIKAVATVKHAAVSDLVDARTSVMMASQIALEVIPGLVAMGTAHQRSEADRLGLFAEANSLANRHKAVIGRVLQRRYPALLLKERNAQIENVTTQRMDQPFTKEAFLGAPIFLLLQVQSIVEAAKESLVDAASLEQGPELLPPLDPPPALTPRLNQLASMPSAAAPISEPSSTDLPKASAALGPAVQLVATDIRSEEGDTAGDTEAAAMSPQPGVKSGPKQEQLDAQRDDSSEHHRTLTEGSGQAGFNTEAAQAPQGTDSAAGVSAPPQLRPAGTSAFSADPLLRKSLSGAQRSNSADLSRDPSGAMQAVQRPTLRELVASAELQWPRLLTAPGCVEVHMDIHETRQQMARAFVSTRSLSDSHSIFITLANDPHSRVPLTKSASARMIGRFKAAGRIVRPLPSSMSVAPPSGLNKFASLASIANATPGLGLGLPSIGLGSLSSLRLPLTVSPGGTPAATPHSTPTASLRVPTPPPLETVASTAAEPVKKAPLPAATAQTDAADAAAAQLSRSLEQNATPVVRTSTNTAHDAPHATRSASAVDSAGGDDVPERPTDLPSPRPAVPAPMPALPMRAASQPSLAATAAALGIDDELRDIAMQCLAIPDDVQRRPPIPYAASYLPSSQDAATIPVALRQPDPSFSLRQAPMLIAEVMRAVPAAPSWRQQRHRRQESTWMDIARNKRLVPAIAANAYTSTEEAPSALPIAEAAVAASAAADVGSAAPADDAAAQRAATDLKVVSLPESSAVTEHNTDGRASSQVGHSEDAKPAPPTAKSSSAGRDGDGERGSRTRSDSKFSKDKSTPKRKR